ncbi:hypothetical protein CLAFUW4_14277 [Fulvia fulva]|uniref:Uncharacterized protein n=1 Tax=Passalora fulva TaxID=5499 RepID=A0A9Q8PM92_PASFU|nr:uncharacterized protein CLAFUR5_14110 [Fulvia fulva]KAK4609048.1 hypothetical protein CLAFUR4_14277 [Fulvia fulva]KAK4609733.1 hypothetical protein CLAFUR0_14281 [Fulvia fulva]UJO25025.1 hypothetical protein CLAFUR5_14110 [Fulvia fulva]WPV22650.1 hypothetical protein CLAFUW4_14277 [Fulvia fulva]WPV37429.1 hypothetical protein CLAFUW7_14285 [Fulvia fulva]
MANELFWVNRDATSGHVAHSSKEERSAIQSKIQRGRPRKRKPKAKSGQSGAPSHEPQQTDRPKELYDHYCQQMTITLDPFDAATVKLDSTISGLLRYYVYYHHPAQWPNEPFESRGPYTFKTSVARVVSTAVEDEMMMFCLLAAATCRLQYVDHLSYANVSRNEDVYSARALQLLRTRVETEAHSSSARLDVLL